MTQRVVILSADTDVVVVCLYHLFPFPASGLQELWLRDGIDDTTGHILLHKIASRRGPQECQILPALHTFAGCDSTSKFCTKHWAVSANPVSYLTAFGTSLQDADVVECLVKAERYVIQVLQKGTSAQSMDELRYNNYHNVKTVPLDTFPPPSHSTFWERCMLHSSWSIAWRTLKNLIFVNSATRLLTEWLSQ